MTPEQFIYWLQGYAEISDKAPTEKQWEVIKDHLKLVFDKQTPDRSVPLNNPPTKYDLPMPPYEVTCNTPFIC